MEDMRVSDKEILIRMLDLWVTVVMIVVTAPAMALIAVLVKRSSPGPVIYRQPRVGKGGKPFTLLKFRTMVDHAEDQTGPVWARPDDPRITSVGGLLRRSRLDELPQLFNVLRGQMSLVGPRPERPFFVQRERCLQGLRLAVKPGLTGLAQIRGPYSLSPRRKARYDRLYIHRRSLSLNVLILLRTVRMVLTMRGQ
jgi:lipopolysaccharide/colanic/teichoic acid biosynthesis glycosyltransferase